MTIFPGARRRYSMHLFVLTITSHLVTSLPLDHLVGWLYRSTRWSGLYRPRQSRAGRRRVPLHRVPPNQRAMSVRVLMPTRSWIWFNRWPISWSSRRQERQKRRRPSGGPLHQRGQHLGPASPRRVRTPPLQSEQSQQ